jgi:threonine/homoserine/homoserine lactone efflux protein
MRHHRVSLYGWLSLASVCLLGAMSPGPSLAVVVSQTLTGGTRLGLCAALAHGLGVAIYALAWVSGLALMVSASAGLFSLIQWAGALFLLYLGIKSLRSTGSVPGATTTTPGDSAASAMLAGFTVAFLNPKLAIFFLALFSQFVEAGASPGEKALMVLTVGGIDGLWYASVSLLLGKTGVLERLRSSQRIIDRVFGIILILLAIRLVV